PTQGIGFAIVASTVRDKVQEFTKIARGEPAPARPGGKSVAREHFGLQLQDLTPELTEALGYDASGVLISDVDEGGPAEEAGIHRGSVIYKVGVHAVSSVKDVNGLLDRATAGTRVDFVVGA